MRCRAHEDNQEGLRYNCRDFILDQIDRSGELSHVFQTDLGSFQDNGHQVEVSKY